MSLKEQITGLIDGESTASEDELKTKLNEITDHAQLKAAVATITGMDQLKAALKAIHDIPELKGGKRRKTRRTKRKGKGKKSRRY